MKYPPDQRVHHPISRIGQGADGRSADGPGWWDPGLVTAGQAETYLRLRAEAELRHAMKLPRYYSPDEHGMPGPLRTAVRLARPGASLIASAAAPALPLARRAVAALQPLGDEAGRRLQPLGAEAVRRLRPLADETARRLQPLGHEAIRRLRPLAGEAVRWLHEAGWSAAEAVQATGWEAADAILSWRRQVAGTVGFLPFVPLRAGRARADAGPGEPSAEEGLQRLRTVASALIQAGAIDGATVESILAGLETALLARSRIRAVSLIGWDMTASYYQQAAAAPAGLYRAVPVGATITAAPDSGVGDTRLLTLWTAPDLAGLTAAGRRPDPASSDFWPRHDRWSTLHNSGDFWPIAVDDSGRSYQLDLGSWQSDDDRDGGWTGTLDISPVPAAGIRWLDLTVSPGSAPIRVDLAASSHETQGATGLIPADSPVGQLFDGAAENLLYDAATHTDGILRQNYHDFSLITDIATALQASGVLPPDCAALDRLVALARHLGLDIPAALSASARPAGLPDAWMSVLENSQRRDGPDGVAAAAAVLPELDGTRFVLAGLRSDAEGAVLTVQGWGRLPDPDYAWTGGMDESWSWWARDDAGRWHMGVPDSGSYGDGRSDMQLIFFPPLHPEATSLEVTLAGSSGRVTVMVPLNWLAPA
jgi:hypothetical protein